MNPTKFFEAQLKELVNDCLFGQFHYRTWHRLHRSFGSETETMDVAPLFFEGTAEAHLNSVKLHLFRLLDDAKGSTSIYELIKYAENNKKMFWNQVKLDNTLERHSKLLSKIKPTIENLRKHRKKHFIHKSKEYLNTGYERLYKEYSATYKDYEEVLKTIGKILNDYLKLFKDGEHSFEYLGEDEEFEDLKLYLRKGIEAIEKENEKL